MTSERTFHVEVLFEPAVSVSINRRQLAEMRQVGRSGRINDDCKESTTEPALLRFRATTLLPSLSIKSQHFQSLPSLFLLASQIFSHGSFYITSVGSVMRLPACRLRRLICVRPFPPPLPRNGNCRACHGQDLATCELVRRGLAVSMIGASQSTSRAPS